MKVSKQREKETQLVYQSKTKGSCCCSQTKYQQNLKHTGNTRYTTNSQSKSRADYSTKSCLVLEGWTRILEATMNGTEEI